ncbi:MAG: hypothetical protein QNJ14_08255 [Woeseiaceae bacterium]|nr:hypothetical protein [Woeseiaceae bacterium]
MKPLIFKLVWPAYLVSLIYLGYIGIDAYSNARTILKDHTVVDAPMEFIRTSSRTKRGHTSVTYHYRYSYTVNGTDHSFPYSAVNEHGERYLEQGYMTIAYSNTEPARSGPLHLLADQSSLGRLIKAMLLAALVLGLVALFVWGWAAPDDDEEDEEVPESARA